MVSPALMAQNPTGWKVLHDKTNTCQMAVPADWKVAPETTWIGQAPNNQGDAEITFQPGKTLKPLSEMAQKALNVAKMFENTPQRIFWSSQQTNGDHPITPYAVRIAAKGGICAGLISTRSGVSEDVVKKIASTFAGH